MTLVGASTGMTCRVEAHGDEVHVVISASDACVESRWRSALNRLADELRTQQIHPSALLAITCSSSQPACFHPGIRKMDLIRREVFGGFDLHVSLQFSSEPLLLHAIAKLAPPGEDPVVWNHYRRSELEVQMSPRSGAPSMEAVFRRKRENSARFRAMHKHAAYDIAYGDTSAETFDLFYPQRSPTATDPASPVWVFIHGGYWQASDKSDVHDLAEIVREAGYAVAMVNYGLCPEVTLRQIVEQVRRGLRFIHREARSLGVDAGQIHLAGTSAGGHLAAMMACDPSLDFVRSALIISGIHDLAPVSWIRVGTLLGLDADSVQTLSPLRLAPRPGVRVGVAVGALESIEFRRMSQELALKWRAPLLTVEGKSHFNVTDHLAQGGPLGDFALAIASGQAL